MKLVKNTITSFPSWILTDKTLSSEQEWDTFSQNCRGAYWQIEETKIYIMCNTIARLPKYNYVFERDQVDKYTGIDFSVIE